MIRHSWLLACAFVAVAALSSDASAQGKKLLVQPKEEREQQESHDDARKPARKSAAGAVMCVVMGDKPIDKKFSAKYNGKDVYFCCARCKAKFEKDPAPYADAVKAQWEALKPLRVQVTCPNDAKPVDKAVFVKNKEYGEVHFCCKDCKVAWEKDSKTMRSKLPECFTYQTNCPVGGEPIDPASSTEYQGKTIYLCCNDCIAKFKADPAKYLGIADEQVLANKAAQQERDADAKEAGMEGKKGAGGDKPISP